ncbi:thiol-disulfide oxidoreductase DCC family protein [Paenibacillus aurantius]|uniref:Thiol-disulfide oxidoreductase DCC family protein n=1 Tax=Paenibacillus aurantius TaxID=2918900 RepID=A0AA96LCN4_9BACL|nr:thiol-disulfide oxidoreductase DCC family protein [Paenibacillus aurantius]WJH35480.1 thiol-disulfide oxidoreductase DCC family protein [Paenibacillus sp. CC-CFT747]WNQ10748.1 thiol-disulfide oxidoreductase DCC family protein [Paenibacillus aurantius]
MEKTEKAILLYDGVCNLCSFVIRFVIPRDRAGKFVFASLQSETGRRLLLGSGLDPDALDTFVMVRGERTYIKSSAALRVLHELGGVWSPALLFLAVPRPIRDFVYDRIARNRYRWFGRTDSCLVPTPDIRERFIDS